MIDRGRMGRVAQCRVSHSVDIRCTALRHKQPSGSHLASYGMSDYLEVASGKSSINLVSNLVEKSDSLLLRVAFR
jgi:hypothetical protein